MLGMKPEDLQQEIVLWATNLQSFGVFEAMGTQWRMGMGGATGLDYQALPTVMDMIGLDAEHRPAAFQDVRLMEREALHAMADSRES
jgi:hypothetical protein